MDLPVRIIRNPVTGEEVEQLLTEAEIAEMWPDPTVKIWLNAQMFMEEFTPQEMSLIGLSTNPVIAGLRVLLSVWRQTVRSDDARVIAGVNELVFDSIITPERRAAIMTP